MRAYEQNVLQRFPAADLGEEHSFCAAVGKIQGEFLVIHPFREGNARTIKLATNLLAAQTGRTLLVHEESAEGQRQYVEAARVAFKRDYAPMIEIIRQAIARAENRQ
jgi:cell filamentation protein